MTIRSRCNVGLPVKALVTALGMLGLGLGLTNDAMANGPAVGVYPMSPPYSPTSPLYVQPTGYVAPPTPSYLQPEVNTSYATEGHSHSHSLLSSPTYGTMGVFPYYQGFGLGYHLGFGYGDNAIGVGPNGGYPFYAGPGYPHASPRLRRFGHLVPFAYYGGPGGPSPEHPNYYAGVGPLVGDRPVVTMNDAPPTENGYGNFTGVMPYPDDQFARFTAQAAARGTSGSGAGMSSGEADDEPASRNPEAASVPALGLEVEPTDAEGIEGIKVTRVKPDSIAEKADLMVGDIIEAANGHLTKRPGHLAWIIGNITGERVLKMRVRASVAAEPRTIEVTLP